MAIKNACLIVGILLFITCFVALAPKLTADGGIKARERIAQSAMDSMESFRRERKASREAQLKELSAIMKDDSASEEIRRDAGEMRLELINNAEKETTVEGVLGLRGFADVLCTVHGASVNVLVRADELSPSQSAIIMELTVRETGREAADIKIMPVS